MRVIPTDGRNYILATPKYYDVITAEPSNPWIAGIANLYTREFYQVIKSKIKDDGIFAQWFHNYSMSPDDFRMVFRTFAEAFPHVSLWSMKESDFLLIGSKQEQTFDYAAVKAIYDSNEMLQLGSRLSGALRCLCRAGFLSHGQGRLSGVLQGRRRSTPMTARSWSSPRRRTCAGATTELNRRIMTPFLVDTPPWLKTRPAGARSDASFLPGAILRRERVATIGP